MPDLRLFVLLVGVCSATQYKEKYWEGMFHAEEFIQEESYFSCTCDGKYTKIDIPKDNETDVYEKLRSFEYCDHIDENYICKLYKECHNCSFHMVECQPNATSNKYLCLTKNFITNEEITPNANIENFITHDDISPKNNIDYVENLTRHRRDAYCPLPPKSKTFDIICKSYPDYVKCHQICVQGYTLKKGLTGRRRCYYKEGKWRPTDFNECKPFINCALSLKLPGFLECTPSTTSDLPSCNVTCGELSHHPASPMDTLECRITGTWDKKLPYCVTPKSGIELVPPPKINFNTFQEVLQKF